MKFGLIFLSVGLLASCRGSADRHAGDIEELAPTSVLEARASGSREDGPRERDGGVEENLPPQSTNVAPPAAEPKASED